MYVGSTGLFGLIHYFVCPISLLLAHNAKRISLTVDEAIHVVSDVAVTIKETNSGCTPSEGIRGLEVLTLDLIASSFRILR